jgi:hypothetical protein
MVHRIIGFLTSLRLTVACLILALILVFVGTLAEVHMGLYAAQSEIFRSFLVYWSPEGSHIKIPVYPGGWLIGLTLLVNLIAAHIKRFQWSRKKIGIVMIHGGLIFLLLGQFLTETFQIESQMRLPVGSSRNYAEDSRKNELAIIDVTDPDKDVVTVIPEAMLVQGGDIHAPGLPFTLHVKNFLPNASPAGPMSGGGAKIQATQGIGQRLLFTLAPPTTSMEDEDKPTALVQVISDKDKVPIGDWTVSTWLSKPAELMILGKMLGDGMGLGVDQPQSFTTGGRTYELALRPVRYYKPYTITMLQFKHDLYAGTAIPSNFASTIHLSDPSRGVDRDVRIYMNNPLRYRGETFYQASFEPGDKVSVLQVVRNPAAVTPYAACTLIALGLLTQFLMHLVGFAKKRAQQLKPAPAPARKVPASVLGPALAAAKRSNV